MSQPTTYTAAVATASDCVPGDYCDVLVLENEITGYRTDGDSELERPEYGMTSVAAMDTIETDVRVDDEDALTKAGDAADHILAENGWHRIEDWTIAHNAMYALVERA